MVILSKQGEIMKTQSMPETYEYQRPVLDGGVCELSAVERVSRRKSHGERDEEHVLFRRVICAHPPAPSGCL